MRIVDHLREVPQKLEEQKARIKKKIFKHYYRQARKMEMERNVEYPNLEKVIKTRYAFPVKESYIHSERYSVVDPISQAPSLGSAVPNANRKDYRFTNVNPLINSVEKDFTKSQDLPRPKKKLTKYQINKRNLNGSKNLIDKEFGKETFGKRRILARKNTPFETDIAFDGLNTEKNFNKYRTIEKISREKRYRNTGQNVWLKPTWGPRSTKQVFSYLDAGSDVVRHDYPYQHPADRLLPHYSAAKKNFRKKINYENTINLMKRDAFKVGAGVAVGAAIGGAAYYAYKKNKSKKNTK